MVFAEGDAGTASDDDRPGDAPAGGAAGPAHNGDAPPATELTGTDPKSPPATNGSAPASTAAPGSGGSGSAPQVPALPGSEWSRAASNGWGLGGSGSNGHPAHASTWSPASTDPAPSGSRPVTPVAEAPPPVADAPPTGAPPTGFGPADPASTGFAPPGSAPPGYLPPAYSPSGYGPPPAGPPPQYGFAPGPYPAGPAPAGPYGFTGYGPGAPQQFGADGPGRQPPHLALAGAPTDAVAEPKRTHRWGLGAYLIVELVFLLASALFAALLMGEGDPTPGALAVMLAAPTVLAASLAILITRLRGNGPLADLRLRFTWRDVWMGLAFGLGGLLVTIPASVLYVTIVGPDASSAVGDVVGDMRASPWLAFLIFAIVVFVAPICEEIVYRGLLWGAVERLGANRWVALAVTTLLFALAHFELTRTPLLLVVAIPIALARLYTGGLLASIVAHQINNLLPGIALLLGLLGVMPTV